MAVFKCKTCGGDVEPLNDGIIGKCLYCGSMQTLPKEKDEKISQLLNRANDFRLNSDFDRAIFEYEKVLELDEAEPEAHWGIFLSKYGVEYVKDTMTQMYKPTLHRISTVSVYDDVDYQATLKYASYGAAMQYKEDAEHIEMVMKELLLLSANQEPYDIFLSYKELDDVTRQRTDDSYLAHDLYNELTAQEYRVFFAPKSLIGVSLYEPKIYSAIISSKVMIVLGTRPEYLMGVWVKNEWSRFAEAIENGEEKVLIPVFKNMEASQLPNRIAKYQAYNMASMTFLPSLFDAVSKSVKRDNRLDFNKISSAEDAFVERGFLALEDREFSEADSFFEKALNINPHNSQVYFGKLMVEMRINKKEQILTSSQSLKNYKNFEKALRFADQQLKTVLLQYEEKVQYTLDEQEYNRAMAIVNGSLLSINDYENAVDIFKSISNFKDSKEKEAFCLEKINAIKKDAVLDEAKSKMIGNRISNYNDAIEIFDTIPGWKDADKCVIECNRIIAEIKAKEEADRIECERQAEIAKIKAQENIKRIKKLATIITPIICVIIVVTVLLNNVIIPNAKYKDALALMYESKYSEAVSIFEALGDYKESLKNISECKYNSAISAIENGNYIYAYEELTLLNEYKDSMQMAESIYDEYKLEKIKSAKIGDLIFFGAYEQDNDNSNGKENIEWLVLDIDDEKALVISNVALDYKSYNENFKKITWRDSSLRKWLNYEFLNSAFSKDEKIFIPKVIVSSETYTGTAAQDYIFLLSSAEVKKYFSSDDSRQCIASDYAMSSCSYNDKEVCTWWLRSHAEDFRAQYVKNDGLVWNNGYSVDDEAFVRPAMWIDLSKVTSGNAEFNESEYIEALSLLSEEKYAEAAIAFGKLGDYKDSKKKSKNLWDKVAIRECVSATMFNTYGLNNAGTVSWVGSASKQRNDISSWKNIVAISAGDTNIVGLKSDGTVVSCVDNVIANYDVSDWKNIVAISAGDNYVVGIKIDGTVEITDCEEDLLSVSTWNDIIAISASDSHIVGLKVDGTVVATGNNNVGQCDVSNWKEIVAISTGYSHTVGVKSDGTVVATGSNNCGQCDVTNWTDMISISTNTDRTMGLKKDGTVVVTKYKKNSPHSNYGQYDISGWSNIVAIAAGDKHTIGLKKDGTLISTKYTGDQDLYFGQCDVSDWKNIKLPESK